MSAKTYAKGGRKKADRTGVQSVVRQSLERAVKYYEQHLKPEQKDATDYYHGRPFGDEQDGRSKVVSTDVRDSILALMPSLLDVFFGAERAVEYGPWDRNDAPMAEQATDYVNHVVIQQDNRGYLTYQAWFQDACVRKIGVVKWWWEKFCRVECSEHTGLDDQAVAVLASDPDVSEWEILAVRGTAEGEVYDVRVTRKDEQGRARFEAVPPEEFVFTPNARSLGSAPLVAHVREVARDELVALGIDSALIDKAVGRQTEISRSAGLDSARQFDGSLDAVDQEDGLDESQRPILFAEAYVLVDGDGDGIAERRKFWCVGPDYEIANGDGLGEIVDEIPFAVLCPYPEAHTIVGLGVYDLLKDVQRVKSQILRSTLNSLALAVEPKMEVVVGEVNMKDLLSPDIHGIVRVQKPGMMREIGHEFVGPATLPMLEHYDAIKEDRTGRTKAAAGLDPDSLQSSTKAAVSATVSASQASLKWVARNFAETGIRDLMKGLLRLTVKNQRRARTVRLRNQWVEIDPRHWNSEMDVVVSVGLGQGTPEDRVSALGAIIDKQMTLMQAGAPIVGWKELRNSLARAVEMVGFRSADEFFKPFGPDEEAQMAQQSAQQQPEPSADMMIAQIEGQKAQHEAAAREMELQIKASEGQERLKLDHMRLLMEDQRERDFKERELALKEAEIEAKYSVQVVAEGMSAHVEHQKNQMQAEVEHKRADNEADMAMMQPEPTNEAPE